MRAVRLRVVPEQALDVTGGTCVRCGSQARTGPVREVLGTSLRPETTSASGCSQGGPGAGAAGNPCEHGAQPALRYPSRPAPSAEQAPQGQVGRVGGPTPGVVMAVPGRTSLAGKVPLWRSSRFLPAPGRRSRQTRAPLRERSRPRGGRRTRHRLVVLRLGPFGTESVRRTTTIRLWRRVR